jgi:hypothetical protein
MDTQKKAIGLRFNTIVADSTPEPKLLTHAPVTRYYLQFRAIAHLPGRLLDDGESVLSFSSPGTNNLGRRQNAGHKCW